MSWSIERQKQTINLNNQINQIVEIGYGSISSRVGLA